MNKIRTSVIAAALAGGSVLGLAGISGFADAASSDVASSDADQASAVALAPGDGEELTDDERAERREARRAQREEKRQEIADVIGISVEELGEQVRAGSTLAEIAEANGADVGDVVAVMVEHKTERIETGVENGRITEDEAAEITDGLADRVQNRVENASFDGERRGDRGDRGPRGRHHADVEAPAEDTSADDGEG